MTIEPSAFWIGIGSAIGLLIAAIAYAIRQYASSRTETSGNESKGRLALVDAQVDGVKTLNAIASRFVDGQENVLNVIRDNTIAINQSAAAINQNAAEMRGMLAMLDGQNKLVRDVTLVVDDISAQVTGIGKVTSTLKTDIGEGLTTQIGTVVIAIQAIGKQLEMLNTTMQSKDEVTVSLMQKLQFSFGALETTLLKMLEPIAIRTAEGLIHEKRNENGSGAIATPTAE